jgi:4-alpha-glucanotransferase
MRSCGILLHPTSLPGPHGIGDLGPNAYRWIDTLSAMKQHWWQVLPLGPTGLGNSPYMSYSAFAGNVNLLSPELLHRDGLLPDDVLNGRRFPDDHVDFDAVTPFKTAILRQAFDTFRGRRDPLAREFESYCDRESSWLSDYSLFMAIRSALGGRAVVDWPVELLRRDPVAIAHMERSIGGEIRLHRFGQFLFDRQWSALKAYALNKNVRIIGDVPIFVALDSADVWANPKQFLLDEDHRPCFVAGVPPDYFSEDGQLWGNPIYDWKVMAADGFSWWIARIKRALNQMDLIRMDHFRGFAQAWHVPSGDKTAKNGKWIDGPGEQLFVAIRQSLDDRLPLIAEDLGVITPDVDALRISLGLPGMRVLQFGVGPSSNPYQPHNYELDTVCYTGTHDNDTTAGWYDSLNESDKRFWQEYLGHPISDPGWQFAFEAMRSVANIALVPWQDWLGLGSNARMNTPGVAEGNWGWRFRPDQIRPCTIETVSAWTERFGRVVVSTA